MRADLLRDSFHGIVAPAVSRSTLSRAVARGELVRLTGSAFLIPGVRDEVTDVAAALLTYPAAVASHRAAAWMWRFDGVDAMCPDITLPYAAAPTIGIAHRSNDLLPFEVRETTDCG